MVAELPQLHDNVEQVGVLAADSTSVQHFVVLGQNRFVHLLLGG